MNPFLSTMSKIMFNIIFKCGILTSTEGRSLCLGTWKNIYMARSRHEEGLRDKPATVRQAASSLSIRGKSLEKDRVQVNPREE